MPNVRQFSSASARTSSESGKCEGVATFTFMPSRLNVSDDRVAHAVAVAEPRHRLALEAAAVLEDRERVAEGLDRVVPVSGLAVDDGDGRRLGQLAQHGDGLRPRHDRVQETREHATCVGHALAAGKMHLPRSQVDGVAAQLRHAGLEADARARRRVVEDHAQMPAGQERRHMQLVMEVFERHRQLDQLEQLLPRIGLVGHEVAAAELRQRRQRPALQLMRLGHRPAILHSPGTRHLIGQTIKPSGVLKRPSALPRSCDGSALRSLPEIREHHVLPETVGALVVEALWIGRELHGQTLDDGHAEGGELAEIRITAAGDRPPASAGRARATSRSRRPDPPAAGRRA